MPASAIDRFPANRRNELMEKLSRNARRLRGQALMGTAGTLTAPVGRTDAFEQLLVRLGAIPIVALPSATSLQGYVQVMPARRPALTEQVTVAGGTSPMPFGVGASLSPVAFTAGGNAQPLTATDSVDTAAKGRALIDILS
jgi:hypothetical protein